MEKEHLCFKAHAMEGQCSFLFLHIYPPLSSFPPVFFRLILQFQEQAEIWKDNEKKCFFYSVRLCWYFMKIQSASTELGSDLLFKIQKNTL